MLFTNISESHKLDKYFHKNPTSPHKVPLCVGGWCVGVSHIAVGTDMPLLWGGPFKPATIMIDACYFFISM